MLVSIVKTTTNNAPKKAFANTAMPNFDVLKNDNGFDYYNKIITDSRRFILSS